MGDFTISPGEKFAIVAIPGAMSDGSSTSFPLRLADDLWALRALPVTMAEHWREWIGSTRSKEIEKASLLLVAKRQANSPGVLDGENQEIETRATTFYWGVLAVAPLICSNAPTVIGGGCHEESCDVRRIGWLPQPHRSKGTITRPVDADWLVEAAAMADSFDRLRSGFGRLHRALNAFHTAISTWDHRERLHQFARCIEGFTYGGTAKQFAGRTQTFVGRGHYELMHNIYNLRSTIEHLNDLERVLPGTTDRQREAAFIKAVLVTETVARYCVRRLFSSASLRSHFVDHKSIAAFWKMEEAERAQIWGVPFDLGAFLLKVEDYQHPGQL